MVMGEQGHAPCENFSSNISSLVAVSIERIEFDYSQIIEITGFKTLIYVVGHFQFVSAMFSLHIVFVCCAVS